MGRQGQSGSKLQEVIGRGKLSWPGKERHGPGKEVGRPSQAEPEKVATGSESEAQHSRAASIVAPPASAQQQPSRQPSFHGAQRLLRVCQHRPGRAGAETTQRWGPVESSWQMP
jgi:hypothetical protein